MAAFRLLKALSLGTALLAVTASAAQGVSAQDLNGQISGVVVDASGTPLSGQRVELRRDGFQGSGRIVVVTDELGMFMYKMLSSGQYHLELVVEGRAVIKSPKIELSDSLPQVTNITLALTPAKVHKGRSELAKLLIFVGVTAAVGVVAVVIAVVAAGGV